MSALLGASKSEVFFGPPVSQLRPVQYKGFALNGDVPAHAEGDLLIAYCNRNGSTALPDTPPGFTLWKSGTQNAQSSVVNQGWAIFYRFAPAGGVLTAGDHLACYVFSNVSSTNPFGAYAQQSSTGGFGTNPTAPASTMTNTIGNSLVVQTAMTMFPGNQDNATYPGGNYVALHNVRFANAVGVYRTNRTTAAISAVTINNPNVNGYFAWTFELLAGPGPASPPLATAVYWNNVRVWPDFNPVGPTRYTADATVPIPRGCRSIDVVTLGGGGGANFASTLGSSVGGRAGVWGSKTLQFNRDFTPGVDAIVIDVGGGGSGGRVLAASTAGEPSVATVNGTGVNLASNGGGAGGSATAAGVGPTALAFNGRNYTGGAGGTSGGNNGGLPGAGGGGGNGGVTGLNGGNGAGGAVWLYFY